ncbi:hypothetical protein GH742_04555 [Legionella sp. MW5194]|uniref:bacteriophage holin n=1 Tax=Legionella sp. MW5194 TaxID=2662448 RepID=UPI00193EB3BC|nr:bacteriophage holin [Legionella sp. MW5194]QRN03195.1 hypothetical protein GH742_04555 [Legionella sp. MW5194]
MNNARLSPVALGLALGIFWGISILIMGLIATYYAYGKPFVASMGLLYPGFEPTVLGSLIGAVIGFVDLFIGGVIIALLYNAFAGVCCRQSDRVE